MCSLANVKWDQRVVGDPRRGSDGENPGRGARRAEPGERGVHACGRMALLTPRTQCLAEDIQERAQAVINTYWG